MQSRQWVLANPWLERWRQEGTERLENAQARKPAGIRDDHLSVTSVLSLKDRRERSRSLGKL